MNEAIKPCRLCGSHGQIVIKHNKLCSPEFTTYSVACSFCGAESRTYFSAHEVIDDWNDRQVRRCA
jgi:hypothetical protein